MKNISAIAAILFIGVTMVAGSFWGGNYKAADISEAVNVETDTAAADTGLTVDTTPLFETRGYTNALRYSATVGALIDTSSGDEGDTARLYLAQLWNDTYTVVASDSGALPLTVSGYLTDDTLLTVEGFVWIWSVSVYDTSDSTGIDDDFTVTGEWLVQ